MAASPTWAAWSTDVHTASSPPPPPAPAAHKLEPDLERPVNSRVELRLLQEARNVAARILLVCVPSLSTTQATTAEAKRNEPDAATASAGNAAPDADDALTRTAAHAANLLAHE